MIPQFTVSAAQSLLAFVMLDDARVRPRLEVIVSWSVELLFDAVSPSKREGSDTATPVEVVVQGAFNRVANEARVVSTSAPIRTFPAVVPIGETNVNVCPLITTVSFAVG